VVLQLKCYKMHGPYVIIKYHFFEQCLIYDDIFLLFHKIAYFVSYVSERLAFIPASCNIFLIVLLFSYIPASCFLINKAYFPGNYIAGPTQQYIGYVQEFYLTVRHIQRRRQPATETCLYATIIFPYLARQT
jgi:hypothetical protein